MEKSIVTFMFSTALAFNAHGQGANQFQGNATGDQYLLNPAPPMFPVAPRSVTVGTAAYSGSNFNIFGSQGNLQPFNLMEIHSGGTNRGFMRWYRGPLTNEQMGRIFFNDATNAGFNLQATQLGGMRWSERSGQTKVRTSSTHDHKEELPKTHRRVQDEGGA